MTDFNLLKLIDLRGSKAFVLFVACVGVSVGSALKIGQLGKIPDQWVYGANIGALVFGAMTIVWLVGLAVDPLVKAWRRRRSEASIRELLDSLGGEERELLMLMRQANQQSITRAITDPVALRLKQKGLLLPGGGVGHMMEWPFAVPMDVWRVLRAMDW